MRRVDTIQLICNTRDTHKKIDIYNESLLCPRRVFVMLFYANLNKIFWKGREGGVVIECNVMETIKGSFASITVNILFSTSASGTIKFNIFLTFFYI